MKRVLEVTLAPMSRTSKRALRLTSLFKVIEKFWKKIYWRSQARLLDGQEFQLDIVKNGREMSLITVLAKSKNFAKSENWKRQIWKSTTDFIQIETNLSVLQKVAIFFKLSDINAINCWKLHGNFIFWIEKICS